MRRSVDGALFSAPGGCARLSQVGARGANRATGTGARARQFALWRIQPQAKYDGAREETAGGSGAAQASATARQSTTQRRSENGRRGQDMNVVGVNHARQARAQRWASVSNARGRLCNDNPRVFAVEAQ